MNRTLAQIEAGVAYAYERGDMEAYTREKEAYAQAVRQAGPPLPALGGMYDTVSAMRRRRSQGHRTGW